MKIRTLSGWFVFMLLFGMFSLEAQNISSKSTDFEAYGHLISQGKTVEGIAIPGMLFSFELQRNRKVTDASLRWEIRTDKKGVVFDSQKSSHEGYRLYTIADQDEQKMELYVDYNEIAMQESGDAEIRVFVILGDGREEQLVKTSQFLALPKKYKFEDQYITAENVNTRQGEKDGVAGLFVELTVKFKLTGPRIDPERGDYFFILNLNDAGGRALLHHYEITIPHKNTCVNRIGLNPQLSVDDRQRISFFIPFRLIPETAGQRLVQVVVLPSDWQNKAHFPEILKADIPIDMPEVNHAKMTLKSLILAAKDPVSGAPYFGSHKPDLNWELRVGNDVDGSGEAAEGSLSAVPGSVSFAYCKGDLVQLVVLDSEDEGTSPVVIDKVALDLPGGGNGFLLELTDEGLFEKVSVSVEQEEYKPVFKFDR